MVTMKSGYPAFELDAYCVSFNAWVLEAFFCTPAHSHYIVCLYTYAHCMYALRYAFADYACHCVIGSAHQ